MLQCCILVEMQIYSAVNSRLYDSQENANVFCRVLFCIAPKLTMALSK